jgi:predicted branched-subunit amino acid permease
MKKHHGLLLCLALIPTGWALGALAASAGAPAWESFLLCLSGQIAAAPFMRTKRPAEQ